MKPLALRSRSDGPGAGSLPWSFRFDSPVGGIACPRCHEKLIALQTRISLLTVSRSGAPPCFICPTNSRAYGAVVIDSLVRCRQEAVGLMQN